MKLGLARFILPLLFILVLPRVPSAHDGRHQETLRLLLKPSGLWLSVHYALEPGQASIHLRQSFDQNGDRRLDKQEVQAALRGLDERLLGPLRAQLGKTALPVQLKRRDGLGLLGPVDSSEAVSVTVQAVFPFQMRAGKNTLRLVRKCDRDSGHLPLQLQLVGELSLLEHNALVDRRGPRPALRSVLSRDQSLVVDFSRKPR